MKKKEVFLIIGILSFLCLLSAILFVVFYDYYPVEPRAEQVEEEAKNDTKNYETIGWVRVQGTNIDYPVIYAPGYDFDGMTNNFAWNEVKTDEVLNKVNITGHNITNLSANPKMASDDSIRFESLMSFIYLDFVKDNKFIQYTYNGKDYVYEVYAVSFPEYGDTDVFVEENFTKEEMKEYIEQSLEDSIFKFDIDVNENDKILYLVTCTRMFGYYQDIEFKVDARLVRRGELKLNYDVAPTEKYQEVKEIMEGGENNGKA